MNSNKKLNALENALEKSDFSDSFAENPIVMWISHNGKTLLWVILGTIALLLLGYRLIGMTGGGNGKDYAEVEKQLELFLADEKQDIAPLASLLKRHPELQAKYEGLIAQILMIRGQSQTALPFAKKSLARLTTQENIPYYQDYSTTALLIVNQQDSQALEEAKALEAKMLERQEGQKWGPALYAVNLLRIATLQQKLGMKDEELQSWQKMKKLLQAEAKPKPVLQSFTEGKLSLLDYIAFREKQLQN